MDEDELRAAFRTATTLRTPPPMESAAALAAGHRAVRRRAARAGAGLTAVLVAATSAAVAWGLRPGEPAVVSAQPMIALSPAATKPARPLDGDGQPQEDATSRSGKHYQQGVKLLSLVAASIPPGWRRATGKTDSGLPLTENQAEADGKGWSYLASAAVTRNGRTGRLLAEVHTPAAGIPDINPCSLADTFWNMHGDCETVTVGAARVGVVVHAWGDERIDQWAAYRYPDGTVVYTAQSRNAVNGDSNLKPLTTLPLTGKQLAALAVDPKFHLG